MAAWDTIFFYGGLGNDTFIVNNRNDQIVERYGEGTDTVYTHTTYTLPNYVENLTMTGHDNIFGFGNNSDNVLIGNSGNNRLSAGLARMCFTEERVMTCCWQAMMTTNFMVVTATIFAW